MNSWVNFVRISSIMFALKEKGNRVLQAFKESQYVHDDVRSAQSKANKIKNRAQKTCKFWCTQNEDKMCDLSAGKLEVNKVTLLYILREDL